ncbi:MAG: sigma-70 family RNA polymerase sigma factor [Acidobacteriota bacterium]
MTTSQEEKRALEHFVADGSEHAFRRLYRRHTPFLFALALRLTGGHREEAEDALQEAWIRAAERLVEFRGASALRTWLAGFVVNCCRERRRGPHRVVAGHPPQDPGAVPAARGGDRLDLERQIAALPPKQREVLVLYDLQGFTHEEVGSLLAIPVGTSKRRLFDARRNLRLRLSSASPKLRAGDRL